MRQPIKIVRNCGCTLGSAATDYDADANAAAVVAGGEKAAVLQPKAVYLAVAAAIWEWKCRMILCESGCQLLLMIWLSSVL